MSFRCMLKVTFTEGIWILEKSAGVIYVKKGWWYVGFTKHQDIKINKQGTYFVEN